MSSARLRHRAPSARLVCVGALADHRLRFHKIGRDGSAKCDAEVTGNPEDRVLGVVYELSRGDKAVLDRHEGLGGGYDEKFVEVNSALGTLSCWMYCATMTDRGLKPFHWYKEHVLIGARVNGLPGKYIEMIEAVVSIDDPDCARSARELQIYRLGKP